jgi:hypothetical protein
MIALAISLSIWIGPNPSWQLDISPTVIVQAALPPSIQSVTLPHLVIVTNPLEPHRTHHGTLDGVIAHELQHARQYEHLGPGLLLGYALMPTAFEDYLQPEPPWQGTELNCPMFRISSSQVELFPCWTP